jgi:hypothetical protein
VVGRAYRVIGALSALSVGLLIDGAAHADPGRTVVDFSLGPETTWIRSMPATSIGYTQTVSHALAGGDIPSAPSLMFVGFGAALSLSYRRHWVFPLLGGGIEGAVGPSPLTLSTLDGSIVDSHPWTTFRAFALLPGIGYRAVERRWLVSATAQLGLVGYGMQDGIAANGVTQTVEATSNVQALLRLELKVCRRLDPTTRVCASVAPSLYESTFLNGGTAALTMEFGR